MVKHLLSIHIREEIRHGISGSCESLLMAVPRVDLQSGLSLSLSLLCTFRRLRSDPRQLDVFGALLDVHYITQVTLAFMCVLVWPPGSHDSLSLWVQPAPNCQEWPNVNMFIHVDLLQWSTTSPALWLE